MTPRSPRFDYPASSEQIRLSLGLLTSAEREALARREALEAQQQAREATKGPSLFDGREHA